MPKLIHVTVEVPAAHLDSTADWYEKNLLLNRIEHCGYANAVWFEEGVHLIGVSPFQSNSQSMAHLCLAYGANLRTVLNHLERRGIEVRHSSHRESAYIRDRWENKVELCRR